MSADKKALLTYYYILFFFSSFRHHHVSPPPPPLVSSIGINTLLCNNGHCTASCDNFHVNHLPKWLIIRLLNYTYQHCIKLCKLYSGSPFRRSWQVERTRLLINGDHHKEEGSKTPFLASFWNSLFSPWSATHKLIANQIKIIFIIMAIRSNQPLSKHNYWSDPMMKYWDTPSGKAFDLLLISFQIGQTRALLPHILAAAAAVASIGRRWSVVSPEAPTVRLWSCP